MTDQPLDPAATPEDDDAPEIAADDAGASALAERLQKENEGGDDGEDGEGVLPPRFSGRDRRRVEGGTPA